jgi:hypothetical protein
LNNPLGVLYVGSRDEETWNHAIKTISLL